MPSESLTRRGPEFVSPGEHVLVVYGEGGACGGSIVSRSCLQLLSPNSPFNVFSANLALSVSLCSFLALSTAGVTVLEVGDAVVSSDLGDFAANLAAFCLSR